VTPPTDHQVLTVQRAVASTSSLAPRRLCSLDTTLFDVSDALGLEVASRCERVVRPVQGPRELGPGPREDGRVTHDFEQRHLVQIVNRSLKRASLARSPCERLLAVHQGEYLTSERPLAKRS